MIHHNTIRNLNELVESNSIFLNELKKDQLKIQYDLILSDENIGRVYSNE